MVISKSAPSLSTALGVAALCLLPGCSAGDPTLPSASPATGGVASAGSGGMTATTGGAPAQGTGGMLTSPGFQGFEDAGTNLQARVQVVGNEGVCGSCAVLSVQAQGGTMPYTYEWSDPTLSGAGPHTVCPTAAIHYSVTVKDSSAIDSPEFQRPSQTMELPVDLTCTEPPADAGTPPDDGINGCLAIVDPVESTECPSLDATETSVGSSTLGFAPTPGQVYQYTYDQLLPIGIGNPSTVDVYLGKTPCERAQKIFTLHLDNMWTQSYCFRIEGEYRYSTNVIHVNGIPITFGVTPTICDSCTKGVLP